MSWLDHCRPGKGAEMENPRVREIEFIPVDTSLIIKTKEKLSNILNDLSTSGYAEGWGMNCPFDDPNHTIGPNEPCPICGDLNDWGEDQQGNPTTSNCVNYRKNMARDLTSIVRYYSNKIENNRTTQDIYESLREEVSELEAEVFNYGDGKDGVAGEAIDVILCALDLIYKNNPEWTNEDIVAYAEKKCQKWAQKYSRTSE